MDNGIYTAYSGMQAQLDALDILANNLANVNTTGFKEEKAFFTILSKSLDDSGDSQSLNATVNQHVQTGSVMNAEAGVFMETPRDLDIAIEGDGFLAVKTPRGIRYTRNGNLHKNAQSMLATADGFPILGADGHAIKLGSGKNDIGLDGTVLSDGVEVGRLKIVAFDDLHKLHQEGNSLFASSANSSSERSSNAKIRSRTLEQSNVSAISSIVQMVDILRRFESIQKSVSLMNEASNKAIDKLGR
jgi:flagellar basal-body rod protein FlgF